MTITYVIEYDCGGHDNAQTIKTEFEAVVKSADNDAVLLASDTSRVFVQADAVTQGDISARAARLGFQAKLPAV